MLDFLRVTRQSSGLSRVGVVLDDNAKRRMVGMSRSEALEIKPDSEVVYKDEKGRFVFGRVVRVDDNVVRVDVDSTRTLAFDASTLFRVRRREEIRALEQEALASSEVRVIEPSDEIDVGDEDDVVVMDEPSSKEEDDAKDETPRNLYEPPNSDQWWASELEVAKTLKKENEAIERTLEKEPEKVDTVLRSARTLGTDVAARVSIGSRVRRGHDIVRVGNFGDGVAFFIARGTKLSESLKRLVVRTIDVLREVCACFSYNHKYITLFWQRDAISRFTKQRILINVWPIEEHCRSSGVRDPRDDAFAYTYIYGLLIHKLAHFHDAVHGTRHAFYMDELRFEFLEQWISLLESKGFDAQDMDTSRRYELQFWGTQF